MALDPEDLMVQTAIFGREVEAFLGGKIGTYLVKRSENEIQKAFQELKNVSVWRIWKVRELQNQIWRAESFQVWLADAVIAGENSVKVLEDENG